MTTERGYHPDRDESIIGDLIVLADNRRVEPPAELVERVRARLLERTAVLPVPLAPISAKGRRSRLFMRSSLAVLVLAAMVIFGLGQRSSNVLLANVADAIARHKTVRFKIESAKKGDGKPAPTLYWTLDSMHCRIEDPADGLLRIFDYSIGRILILDKKEKTARLIQTNPEKTLEKLKTPRLEQMQVIREKGDAKPSREKLDGRDVLLYGLVKTRGSLTIKSLVWVDPATLLPVRIEEERDFKTQKKQWSEAKKVLRDFVWDPPEIKEPEEFFSVAPPEDYKVEFVDADNPNNGNVLKPDASDK